MRHVPGQSGQRSLLGALGRALLRGLRQLLLPAATPIVVRVSRVPGAVGAPMACAPTLRPPTRALARPHTGIRPEPTATFRAWTFLLHAADHCQPAPAISSNHSAQVGLFWRADPGQFSRALTPCARSALEPAAEDAPCARSAPAPAVEDAPCARSVTATAVEYAPGARSVTATAAEYAPGSSSIARARERGRTSSPDVLGIEDVGRTPTRARREDHGLSPHGVTMSAAAPATSDPALASSSVATSSSDHVRASTVPGSASSGPRPSPDVLCSIDRRPCASADRDRRSPRSATTLGRAPP